jgi:hypothetical protein
LQIEATAIVKKTGLPCLEKGRDLQRRELSVHDFLPIVEPIVSAWILIDGYGYVKTVDARIYAGFYRKGTDLIGLSVDKVDR